MVGNGFFLFHLQKKRQKSFYQEDKVKEKSLNDVILRLKIDLSISLSKKPLLKKVLTVYYEVLYDSVKDHFDEMNACLGLWLSSRLKKCMMSWFYSIGWKKDGICIPLKNIMRLKEKLVFYSFLGNYVRHLFQIFSSIIAKSLILVTICCYQWNN